MDPHDILVLTVAIVGTVEAAAAFFYAAVHHSSIKRYLRIVCGVGALAVAASMWLHLAGVLEHGNQYFPMAVLATMVVAIFYTVADW